MSEEMGKKRETMKTHEDSGIWKKEFATSSRNNSSTHQPTNSSTHSPSNPSTHPPSSEVAIKIEHVSKKYCKSLKQSMLYGVEDIGRNIVGLNSRSDRLRKNEFWAVNDVSFEVRRGETLGIIGPNGAGKTTLLKMLNGIFWPDRGKITVRGKVGALIEVGAGFHPLLTGRENIYINAAILGMTKKEVDKKFDDIVKFAEIGDFIDSPVKFYSSGMFVRLGFAVAAHCEPNILLVDEVLAVGDMNFQNKCFNKIGDLKKNGTAILLVSHNMHIISTFGQTVILLNNGKAKYFDSVAAAIKEYTELFMDKEDFGIEKICSGNDKINFFVTGINKRIFYPGESFSISMNYESLVNYDDTDIDIAILTSNEPLFYFQATNKAYKKKIDLKRGSHELKIKIEDIKINNAMTRIAIAIWSKDRSELLFWWKIPAEFKGVAYSTGKNFLKVLYELMD